MNLDENSQFASSTSADPIWQNLGADLIFIQNAAGEYLSFHWQRDDRYSLPVDTIVGSSMGEYFKPVILSPYQDRITRVLTSLIPERFVYSFAYEDQYIPLELTMTPVLVSNGKPDRVLVMGCVLEQPEENLDMSMSEIVAYRSLPSNLEIPQKMLIQIAGTICRAVSPSSHIYQRLLSQIAQKIRRTLDLKQIWQQTVNSLGQVLGVSRCILCPYQVEKGDSWSLQQTQVVAEYRRSEFPMMLGLDLAIANELGWTQALATLEPVVVERTSPDQDPYNRYSILVVATSYQDQPNGIISLQQCDRFRQWTSAEVEFIRELATHVGTAIAHAILYQELEEARMEAVALSRLKSEFLANTSHELRTPLNGIIGFLKLVLDGMVDDPEEEAEFIQEAHRAALHLLNLINDVLDIAKIEAGRMDIDLALIKVNELLDEVEHFTRAQIQEKGLTFTIQKAAYEDDVIVYGNYQRLLQVMLNLVGNAIKFTHEGGINISLGIFKQTFVFQNQEFPGVLEFRVADTGIGVPIEKQDRLFKAFSQVSGGYTKKYGGTGLGLVISQKLVQTMGGTVKFYSLGEGLGSTVTFTLPLYQEPHSMKN